MRASLGNFLYFVKNIVTGHNGDDSPGSGTASAADGGIKVDRNIPLGAVGPLVSGTTFKLSTITSYTAVPAIETAATDTSAAYVSLLVPRDYDEASDHLALRLAVILAAADAGITLTGTPTITVAGVAPAAKSAVTARLPFTTANVALGTTEQIVEIPLSGYGLKRDNVVSILIAYAGTTSGVADILGIHWNYDSTIVSYNDTTADDNTSGTLPGFGFPLR